MNQHINFLRGLAAICVFCLHFCITYQKTPWENLPSILWTPAWTGVWIFFIISGYLIGKGFYSEKYKTENIRDFCKFYLKRIIRIFPLYFLIVLIDMFFVNTNIYFNGSETFARIFTFRLRNPYADAMTGNLWFISTLVQMYLITPFVWKFIINPIKKLKQSTPITASMLILLLITYLLLRLYWWNKVSWDYFILPNISANIDLFFSGFLLNHFTKDYQDNRLKQILRPVCTTILLVFIIVNTYFMSKLFIGNGTYNLFLKIICPTITLTILLPSIYAYNIEKENYKLKLKSIINNPLLIFNYLGIISFCFYICHCQIMYNVQRIFNFTQDKHIFINLLDILNIKINITASAQNIWACFLVSFIFTLIWAIILYYMLEKQTSKTKI